MVQSRIKGLILIAALQFIFQPCYAATGQSPASQPSKPAKTVTRSKTVTKHVTKKSSHNKSHKSAANKGKKSPNPYAAAHPQIRNPDVEMAPPATNMVANTADSNLTIGNRLVNFVHATVTTLRYSAYKLGGGHFDPMKGVYVVDCSSYIDNVLQSVYPHAYDTLVNATGAERPNSRNYFDFFNRLSDSIKQSWNKVDNVQQLQAGDILVFRYKEGWHHTLASGHVMVVMDKPTNDDNIVAVRVADSAPSGHSDDTRLPHTSGVGIGTLLLKIDPRTGQPAAYAWKENSHWKSNVDFAMARPLDIT